jgi:hypothetical protein
MPKEQVNFSGYQIECAEKRNLESAQIQLSIALVEFAGEPGNDWARQPLDQWDEAQMGVCLAWIKGNRPAVALGIAACAQVAGALSAMKKQAGDQAEIERLQRRLGGL